MKKLTKLFALLLVLALTLGTVSIVMADEPPVGGENEITAGPVTITNAMAGVTYKLYRVMDIHGVTADGQKSAFVTNNKWHAIFGDGSLKDFLTLKDKNTVGTLVTPVQDFVEAPTAQQFAAALFNVSGASAVEPDATATITESGAKEFGNLPFGYYIMVSSRDTSAHTQYTSFTLKSGEGVSVTEKNHATPAISKAVKNGGNYEEAVSADFNTVAEYKITVKAVAGTDTYRITDVLPEQIEYAGSLTVQKVAGGLTTELQADADYTVVVNGKTGFELTLTDACRKLLNDDDQIVITYKGKLLPNATTINPYSNSATLHYDQDKQLTDTAAVLSGYITFHKKDGKTGSALAGAQFVLTKTVEEKTYYAKLEENSGAYNFVEWTENEADAFVITTNGSTTAHIVRGLAAGSYTLVEVAAPKDYIKGEDTPVTIAETRKEPDNVLVGLTTQVAEIVNMPGSTLPETGGIGTTVFYIGGAVLVVAALVLLLLKRRTGSKD